MTREPAPDPRHTPTVWMARLHGSGEAPPPAWAPLISLARARPAAPLHEHHSAPFACASAAHPSWHESGLVVSGCIRFDERDETCAALGVERDAPAFAVVAAACRRWGAAALIPRIIGSYALLIWDERERVLHALRDPFATRPLYWLEHGGTLWLASEMEPLLAAPTGMAHTPDETALSHWLRWGKRTDVERTYWHNVWRLPPGHRLEARRGRVSVVREWRFPEAASSLAAPEAAAEAVRETLFRGMSERLRDGAPVLLTLSGGLDSPCLAGAAVAALRGEGREPAAQLAAFTTLDERIEGPERERAEQVANHLGLPWHRLDEASLAMPTPNDVDDDTAPGDALFGQAGPPFVDLSSAFWERAASVAAQHGAQSIWFGHYGDELFYERWIVADLIARGRLWRAWREAWQTRNYSSQPRRRHIREFAQALMPRILVSLLRPLKPRRALQDPRLWGLLAEPVKQRAGNEPPASPYAVDVRERGNVSRTTATTWTGITDPHLFSHTELTQWRGAIRGLEVVWPFADVRLARLVLTLPLSARVPHGLRKRLLREAARPWLPEGLRNQRGVSTYTRLSGDLYREFATHHPQLFEPSFWRSSADFLNLEWLGRMRDWILKGVKPGSRRYDLAAGQVLLRATMLELWLRRYAK